MSVSLGKNILDVFMKNKTSFPYSFSYDIMPETMKLVWIKILDILMNCVSKKEIAIEFFIHCMKDRPSV